MKRFLALSACFLMLSASLFAFTGCSDENATVVLRVCNWEEYIDLGDWDEAIEIENPYTGEEEIFGENSVVDDFTEWFNENYDFNIKVEYSTFGTNEDLYNMLSLGDVYDLVCPSDYMIMKLLAEDKILPYSKEFFDESIQTNYYAKNVSPFIDEVFEENGWKIYSAGYMWGTTGIVYNPEEIKDVKDVGTWNILLNENYNRKVTIKDNVRDAYFATLGIINSEKLLSGSFTLDELSGILNDTTDETISKAEEVLKEIKNNVYSFETDAGKADMVTGKVIANYQWSGDAVYIMDEAESDSANPTELWYSVPDECANLWFDGWVMLKDGVEGNEKRRIASEAFVNFLSRPDNAVRNMNYIGYTSAIAGDVVYDYLDWCYGAEEGVETYEYSLDYFFGEERSIEADISSFEFDGEYINRGRQLFAQYPPENVKDRSVVMKDFEGKLSDINRMWINVRCKDLKEISPAVYGVVSGIIVLLVAGVVLYRFRYKLFIK